MRFSVFALLFLLLLPRSCLLQMYESPVALSLAESASISLPPALYLKQSGLLDQMRREILCDGASLVQADSTSASVRGNDMITSSVNLMMQLFSQVDSSTTTRAHSDAILQQDGAGLVGTTAVCALIRLLIPVNSLSAWLPSL